MSWNLSNRVVILSSGVMLVVHTAFAVCASTPVAAVNLNEANGRQPLQGDDGYRVTTVRWDPVLRQGWAMVARCGHPEWPEVALPTRARSDTKEFVAAATTPPVVRAGDKVRLWRQENALLIEVAAVAEESGSVGKSIRVRLVRAGIEGQMERQMVGIVRGQADVEMQR
jgi:Zn ribbon nucleic-acid-binding protein